MNTADRATRRFAFMAVCAALVARPGIGATLSVPSPYPTIQSAVDIAVDGDEIVVAPGTYFEHIDLLGRAITLRSLAGAESTTIDGSGAGIVVTCMTGEQADTVIDGFTVTGSGGGSFDHGMLLLGAAATVRNCRFVDNARAGLYVDHGGPTVTGCLFTSNGDSGLWNIGDNGSLVMGCTFTDNSGARGGGMVNVEGFPVVIDCVFIGNTAVESGVWSGLGGAVYNQGFTFAEIINCVFIGNTAEVGGGAIYNDAIDMPQPAHIVNCTFTGNVAPAGAGSAVHSAGESGPAIRSSILWANGTDEVVDEDMASTTVLHSIVQGGWPGVGVVDADPVFVDAARGDLRLQDGSPAVNGGNPDVAPPVMTDLDGGPRVQQCRVDMGAYESAFFVDCDDNGSSDSCDIDDGVLHDDLPSGGDGVPDECQCLADLDGSGAVTFADLLAILAAWGPCPACPQDLDGSGAVGFSDLLTALATWGPCPSA